MVKLTKTTSISERVLEASAHASRQHGSSRFVAECCAPSKADESRPGGIELAIETPALDHLARADAAVVTSISAQVEAIVSPSGSEMGGSSSNGLMMLSMQAVGRLRTLTPKQEMALVAKSKQGDNAALEELLKGHLRRVVKIARNYEGFGLPLLELINEGNNGLRKAIERFDPARGGRLSTRSSWWVRHYIKRALSHKVLIQLPGWAE
jgi:RNA polymerase primary sigma factor